MCLLLAGVTLFDTYDHTKPTDFDVTPTQGMELPGESAKNIRVGLLSHMEADRLRYVQSLDLLNEQLDDDEDDKMWKCMGVLNHKVRTNDPEDVHIKVKAMWLNGERSWVRADAIRLQDPYPLIKYAMRSNITHLEDWKWVQEYSKDPDRLANMTNAFKTAVKGPRFKFGTEVPRNAKHALELDQLNGNDLWKEAMDKELRQINDYKTFRAIDPGETLPIGYKKIPYHMVFDVKFDLRRKARLVAGGNWTDPPKEDIYSGVVGLETIRLGFLLAEMNNLESCAADIGNAFLYGKTREKVYITAGPEFGEMQGRTLIIDKGLYGLRSSSARFHEHLSEKLTKMGYQPSKADPDLWIRDMGDHYDYIARYVDDLVSWSKDPMKVMEELKRDYILKGVGVPEYYLGGNVDILDETWKADDVTTALSAKTYIKNVTEKFEQMLGGELKTFKTPMSDLYHPEMDDSPLLDAKGASQYRAFIGSGNWVITLGRFDVHYAIQSLSRYSMAPREGHLTAVKRVFGYLKKYNKGKVVIDKSHRDTSQHVTPEYDTWKELYPEAEEEMPPDMPQPRGTKARMTVFVDADHAHDLVTRRSVTGILLFVNNTPVRWFSKRQKTVETSTYGSELVAARIATEMIMEMRYVLRMLGVPVDGPTLMLGDNMSVVLNTTVPSSVLKKKHNAIAYHRVREAIAAGIMRFAHIPSETNYADILTKPLPSEKFHNLVQPLLFRQPTMRRTSV